jgi:hypothetical protein
VGLFLHSSGASNKTIKIIEVISDETKEVFKIDECFSEF